MNRSIIFKAKPQGRRVKRPDIKAHHCSWYANPFYLNKFLRGARDAGLLPEWIDLDRLPPHIHCVEGSLLVTITIAI